MSERCWEVGQEYRDRAGFPDDQFIDWLKTEHGSLANAGGIRVRDRKTGGETDPETGRKIPAFVVLITSDRSQYHNPWDDVVDVISGNILYWGDAKYVPGGKRFDQFPGNARLEAINNLRLAGKLKSLPPILHFSRKRSGYVRFNGLCVLSGLSHSWFEDKGHPVKNLRALLAILDTPTVSLEWLKARAGSQPSANVDNALAPDAWKDALKGKVRRRHVYAAQIRSRTSQMPIAGSEDEKILEQLRKLDPHAFEKFTVALVQMLPEIIEGLDHKVHATRRTGDHGVDFFGWFRLPDPIGYQIEFIGEAKRYSSPITPDQVSRLVARLGRGQYGLYFTTSWFSEQTQREILADRYPVRLFSGQDIVNILRRGNCISQGSIRSDWLEAAMTWDPVQVSDGLHPVSILS